MNRAQAIRHIRRIAKARELSVSVDTRKGKGSHIRVIVGKNHTIIPQKLDNAFLKIILKQLKLED